jgi:hypothetical protein
MLASLAYRIGTLKPTCVIPACLCAHTLQAHAGQTGNGTLDGFDIASTHHQLIPIASLDPSQRDMARKLANLAQHAWWRPGHPGWLIYDRSQLEDYLGGVEGAHPLPKGLPQIAVHPACSSDSGHRPNATTGQLEYVSVPPTGNNTPTAGFTSQLPTAPPPAIIVPGVTVLAGYGNATVPNRNLSVPNGNVLLPTLISGTGTAQLGMRGQSGESVGHGGPY